MYLNKFNYILVLLLILFFLDELAFIIYNINLFKYLCSNFLINIHKFPTFYYPIFLFYKENFFYFSSFLKSQNLYVIFDLHNSLNTEFPNLLVFQSTFPLGKLINNSVYVIFFDSHLNIPTNKNLLFTVLQNKLYIISGENNLIFYRFYNNTNYFIKGFGIYYIYPFYLSVYFNKIQCFCYETLILQPFEIVDLPILFQIDNSISLRIDTSSFFLLEYLFVIVN